LNPVILPDEVELIDLENSVVARLRSIAFNGKSDESIVGPATRRFRVIEKLIELARNCNASAK